MTLLKSETVIAHPLRSGLVWAAVTAALSMFAMSLLGVRSYAPSEMPKLVIVWLFAGVAWGYTTRWALLRKAGRTR